MNKESLQTNYDQDVLHHPFLTEIKDDLLAPISIIRQYSGGMEVQLIFGDDGIMGFLTYAPRLTKLLNDWILNSKEMSEELIMNDLNILNEFLLTHKFNKLIDFQCLSKTAVRHVLWCLSKKIEGTHERLYELLEKYSPSKFGYEHGFKYLTLG